MNIGNYIQAKLGRLQLSMADDELAVFLIDQGLTLETVYAAELSLKVKKVFIAIIPELLAAPDIAQGDYSIKFNVDGIKAYYSLLCKETGEQDVFNPSKDTIVDRSDTW